MSIELKTASGSITLAPEDGTGNASVTIPRAGLAPTKAGVEALGIAANSITGALPAISGAALTNLPASGATTLDGLTDVDTSTAAPTDGQVLTWDNAASQWEPADAGGGGGGAWEVISHQVVSSNTASVSFTGLSNTYTAYKLIGTNVSNSANGSAIGMLFSQDGGTTYSTTVSEYAFNAMRFAETSTSIGSWKDQSSFAFIPLNSAGRTYATAEFEMTLGHVNDGKAYKHVRIEATENQNNLGEASMMLCIGRYSGANLATTPINALKITGLFGSQIANGNFTLYGIKTS